MGTVLHKDIGVASKMIRSALRGNRNWGLILHVFHHVANRKKECRNRKPHTALNQAQKSSAKSGGGDILRPTVSTAEGRP
jgi:hypothetical protein